MRSLHSCIRSTTNCRSSTRFKTGPHSEHHSTNCRYNKYHTLEVLSLHPGPLLARPRGKALYAATATPLRHTGRLLLSRRRKMKTPFIIPSGSCKPPRPQTARAWFMDQPEGFAPPGLFPPMFCHPAGPVTRRALLHLHGQLNSFLSPPEPHLLSRVESSADCLIKFVCPRC